MSRALVGVLMLLGAHASSTCSMTERKELASHLEKLYSICDKVHNILPCAREKNCLKHHDAGEFLATHIIGDVHEICEVSGTSADLDKKGCEKAINVTHTFESEFHECVGCSVPNETSCTDGNAEHQACSAMSENIYATWQHLVQLFFLRLPYGCLKDWMPPEPEHGYPMMCSTEGQVKSGEFFPKIALELIQGLSTEQLKEYPYEYMQQIAEEDEAHGKSESLDQEKPDKEEKEKDL